MSKRVVYLNGKFVAEVDARVSIFDSAMTFGDMAFEMTRTFGGQPFRLRDHLDRLYASLRLLEIDCGLTIEEMEVATQETFERNRTTEADDVDWHIMHNASRGPLSFYRSVFPDGCRPTVTINCWPLITNQSAAAERYDKGVDLAIVPQLAVPAHLIDPKAKTRSRVHYQIANFQAARINGGAWPCLLDPDGFLTEGTGWNIFLVKNNTLYSPEPRNILCGVSRSVTIELAAELGIPTVETNLGRYEGLQADEIFCTSTTNCIHWARSFEGQTIGAGKPGPVYQQLLEAWIQLVGIDFVAQAKSYVARLEDWEQQQRNEGSS